MFQSKPAGIPWFLVLVFFLLTLAIGVVGYVYTKAAVVQAEQEKQNELYAIADMQVIRIAGWRQEHLADAIALRDDPFAASGVERFLADPAAAAAAEEVRSWLESLQEQHEYENVLLLDAQGNVRLSAGPEETGALDSHETAVAMDALRGRRVIFSDFYRHASTGHIHLGLFVPLLPQEPNGLPAGVLVVRIDPHQFFYKLVQSWPVPSHTAENLLVRREGDEAVFLNELRHRQDAALSLRLPAGEQRLAAAMAARGEEGVAETLDYRGVPVLAAVRAVPGSNWFLVAKVDLQEIYAPIRERAGLTMLLIGALIAAAGVTTGLLWHRQQARFHRWQYEAEHERRALTERYEHLTRYANDIILLLDRDLNIVDANERAVSSYGHRRAELLQMNLRDVRAPKTLALLEAQIRQVDELNGLVFETAHRRKDGTTFPVESSARVMEIGEEKFYQAIIRDITERKRAEEALQRETERLAVTLNSIGDAVIAVDETGRVTLLNPIAESLTGWSQAEALGRPLKEVFRIINEYTRQPAEDPVQKVLETGKIVGLANHTALIARDGTEYSIADSAAPIRDAQGHTLGVIMVFRNVTPERQREEMLKSSERRFRFLAENARDVIYRVLVRPEPVIEYVSPAVKPITGYAPEEFCAHPSPLLEAVAGIISQGDYERPLILRWTRRDGGGVWVEMHNVPLYDDEGNLTAVEGIARDVTERRQIEDRLRHLSLHDSLTGLHNRAYFEEAMHRLKGGGDALVGVIVCDVDGLKLVNDTLGHNAGDALLAAAADVLRQSFRKGDIIARIGGDEFAVLMPESDQAAVSGASRRIHEAVAEYNATHPEMPLSLSVGFAVGSLSAGVDHVFKEADNNMYREKLHRRQSARSAIVRTMMQTLEARDYITEGHAERLQAMAESLARILGLSEHSITDLRLLAQFHDIGKVGIPDSILFNSGSLTPEELTVMQTHCEIGHRIALSVPDLMPIADWILKHHEWWNGQGYPVGLKGEEIPLACRILSIVDAYDAMTNDRPYRKALTHKEAVAELKRWADTQFDPHLVEKFLQMMQDRTDG